MRIRGGNAKGREIFAPKGLITRPTSDKVKEAIFSVLAAKVPTAKILDLCAGTGNLSFEALSRGAEHAILIEKNSKAANVISKNIANMGLKDNISLLKMDVIKALPLLVEKGHTFNIIFFDPPYEAEMYEPVIDFLSIKGKNLLEENGVLVIEASTRKILPEIHNGLELKKESVYGDTKILYYQF